MGTLKRTAEKELKILKRDIESYDKVINKDMVNSFRKECKELETLNNEIENAPVFQKELESMLPSVKAFTDLSEKCITLIGSCKNKIKEAEVSLSKTKFLLTDKEYSLIKLIQTACKGLKSSSETLYKSSTSLINATQLANKVKDMPEKEQKKFNASLLLSKLEKQSKKLLKEVDQLCKKQ